MRDELDAIFRVEPNKLRSDCADSIPLSSTVSTYITLTSTSHSFPLQVCSLAGSTPPRTDSDRSYTAPLSGQGDGRPQAQHNPHHRHRCFRSRQLPPHPIHHLQVLSSPQVCPATPHPASGTRQGKGASSPSFLPEQLGSKPAGRIRKRLVFAETIP